MANKRPNILFIMTDHQRADSLGMVQAGREVTPNLNQLASNGTVFTRAYTTTPLCVPARTSLATGKYPTKNGVVFNDWKGVRAGDHKPMHQYLAENGYEVGHIGIHHIRVKPSLQERVQFTKWIDEKNYASYVAEHGIKTAPPDEFRSDVLEKQNGKLIRKKRSNTRTAIWPYPEKYFMDNYFCQKSVKFILQRRTRPFALFVYLWAPHPPLRVPEPYALWFPPENLKLPSNVGLPAEGEPKNRRQSTPVQLAKNVSMDEWKKVWAAHLGLVNLADSGIGRILQALKASQQEKNTLIFFSVDHGEHLGQHRMYQKMEMYEQTIRVPLIIRVPGVEARVFDSPVSHLDVMPTLLDLVNIEIPDDPDGTSLKECILRGSSPPDRSLFCQYSGNDTISDIRRAVVTCRYKYIFDPTDIPELYDLKTDPLEMRNLVQDEKYVRIIEKLHEECKLWANSHNDWVQFKSSPGE